MGGRSLDGHCLVLAGRGWLETDWMLQPQPLGSPRAHRASCRTHTGACEHGDRHILTLPCSDAPWVLLPSLCVGTKLSCCGTKCIKK